MKLIKEVDSNSVDLIIADPPYGISKDFGNGDSWSLNRHEEWFAWEKQWLNESKRVLKPNGSIFVYGIHHNIGYVQIPTLTPLPQPATLFADNFDQGLSGSWSIVSGNPVVVNGQLTSDQEGWIRIGDSSWTDYKVEIDATSNTCWFSGPWSVIAIHVQDMDNMIAFKWANCENEWDVVKNGTWTPVPNSHGTSPGGENSHIVISVGGGQYIVEINGQRVSSFFNSDFKQGGVAIKIGPKFLLDNFKVTVAQK